MTSLRRRHANRTVPMTRDNWAAAGAQVAAAFIWGLDGAADGGRWIAWKPAARSETG